jgi:hypothetical protein
MDYSKTVTNYTQVISKLTNFDKVCLAILVITASFGAGYSVSHQPNEKQFDQFSYKALEVNAVMQDFIKNPSEEKRISVHNSLVITYGNWAYRTSGANKELFQKYLIACQDVTDSSSKENVNKMNSLYNQLEK